MDEPTFEISDWKSFAKGALRGFFTVRLPSGLWIHNCGLFEKDGKRWIALPAKKYISASGKVTWKPLIEIPDRDAMDRFRRQALLALDAGGYR